ncbi:uroporphyrinogen-III synthase [Mariniblastus sp.]|nr:uroporphyrinogen-III synthase [Mariniblastus sp.]
MKPADPSPQNSSNHLSGQTVLVTRAADQSAALVQRIEAAGGRAIVHPVIEILPAANLGALDAAIQRLDEFELLVFTSRNGVQFFKDRLDTVKASLPPQIQLAAIGSSTAQLIQELWQIEPAVPKRSHSPSLADFLIDEYLQQKMLLVRGDRGSDVLDKRLIESDADFESVVAYRSVDVTTALPSVVEMFEAGQIGWVTATSSAIGRSVVNLFGKWLSGDKKKTQSGQAEKRVTKLVSISPTTTAAIESVSGEVAAEATEYDLNGLIEAMKL